jgi:hypothetical protein
MIVFMARFGEVIFDYYAQRSPAMGPSVAKIGLPINFLERFPPPRVGRPMGEKDVSPLRLAVESRRYTEVDLVLSHESLDDPNGLVLDYLDQVFLCQEEQRFYGVRIVRFLAHECP